MLAASIGVTSSELLIVAKQILFDTVSLILLTQ